MIAESSLANPALGFFICFGVPIFVVVKFLMVYYRMKKPEKQQLARDMEFAHRNSVYFRRRWFR